MAEKCKKCFKNFGSKCSTVFYGMNVNDISSLKVKEYQCFVPVPNFFRRLNGDRVRFN